MAKKSKTTDQVRLETRFAIFIVYVIYNLAAFYAIDKSTFAAYNIANILCLNFTLSSVIMIWAIDLKNIRGWWNKRWFKAQQRALHKVEVENRLKMERELGYDKIERGKN